MSTYTIKRVQNETEKKRALGVRRCVFIEEQNVPENIEIDVHDNEHTATIHVLALDEQGEAVGAGRLREYEPGIGKIERVAVLAHPGLYKNPEMVRKLIKHGLQGIEVYHPDNDEEDTRLYEALADEYHLVKTAGSDFHGMRGTEIFHADLGAYTVTMETVHHLRELSGAK